MELKIKHTADLTCEVWLEINDGGINIMWRDEDGYTKCIAKLYNNKTIIFPFGSGFTEGQKMSKKKVKYIKPAEEWGVAEWKTAFEQSNRKYHDLVKELKGIFVFLHRALGKIQEITY